MSTTAQSETVLRLTSSEISADARRVALRRFSQQQGWRPSDEILEYHGTGDVANGHLVVEHGLANTAIITFLKRNQPFGTLSHTMQLALLGMSYNNLTEWHCFPDLQGVTCVFNRSQPFKTVRVSLADNRNAWRAEAFEEVAGHRPNPNLRSLDEALIETLSFWKRNLRAEMGKKADNERISSLFNSLLLVRAMEDHRRRHAADTGDRMSAMLAHQPDIGVAELLLSRLKALGVRSWPEQVVSRDILGVFDGLDRESLAQLLRELYENKFAPYEYDFSVMSKQALSRVYEHYVSLLREKITPQMTFFPDLPDECAGKGLGSVYTPQFVARFFARYLKENVTPRAFREMTAIDPACGSGIFLRTLLEMQCDPFQDADTQAVTKAAFRHSVGVDTEAAACEAARLSLSLLHLVLTGTFPRSLRIENADALDFIGDQKRYRSKFDAVISNPPYVSYRAMSPHQKEAVNGILKDCTKGKPDLFLAFLKMGMDIVKPGGTLLYVLPHSFLIAESAAKLREKLASEFWVRFVVDLSEIPVFGNKGVYVVLLVAQRKPTGSRDLPRARIVRCRAFEGYALQRALEGKLGACSAYEIYDTRQDTFTGGPWRLLPPAEAGLEQRISALPRLGDVLTVREGFITGADSVFVRKLRDVPKGERSIYAPYLRDRDMLKYRIPKKTRDVVFYPYVDGKKLSLARLKDEFPVTYAYLHSHVTALKDRKSVQSGNAKWWEPVRPRSPENMMRPKIVTPHLVLMPRFSLDGDGTYAVSHSPLLYPTEGASIELLRYYLGFLNSSVSHWQMMNLSHKYSRGYAMLEPKTLKEMRAPLPQGVSVSDMSRIQELVVRVMQPDDKAAAELDVLFARLCGLTAEERAVAGVIEDE